MIMLIPTFILTDLFLYKPVLIFEALSYIIVWCLFVFGSSVLVQQVGLSHKIRIHLLSSLKSSTGGQLLQKLLIPLIFM